MRPDNTTPDEGDKTWQRKAADWLRDLKRDVESWGGPTRYPTISELIDAIDPDPLDERQHPTCDVCLRRKITGEDLDAFPDGTRCVEIAEALGTPVCWSRANGPCVSIGQERVRELEKLIRSAIDERRREVFAGSKLAEPEPADG